MNRWISITRRWTTQIWKERGTKKIVNQQARAEWRACDWVRGRKKGGGLCRVRKTMRRPTFHLMLESRVRSRDLERSKRKNSYCHLLSYTYSFQSTKYILSTSFKPCRRTIKKSVSIFLSERLKQRHKKVSDLLMLMHLPGDRVGTRNQEERLGVSGEWT